MPQNYKGERDMKVKVYNMKTTGGNIAPNQFIIKTVEGLYFQSYEKIIAFRPYKGTTIQLDELFWDYSRTTGKYRGDFLGEGIEETRRKIASGEYILTNLN